MWHYIYDTDTYFDWSISSFYMQVFLFKNDMLNLQQTIHAKEMKIKKKMKKTFELTQAYTHTYSHSCPYL